MQNGPPSRCVPEGVVYLVSSDFSNLPSMIARICSGLGVPPSPRCAALDFAQWSFCISCCSPAGHVSSSCEMFIVCWTYSFKDEEAYYPVAARLFVYTVNEHNSNGLDVKVTITRLNSYDTCMPHSFLCAWDRQAKLAAPSAPHEDVYDLHDANMWYLSSDYMCLVRCLFRLSDIALHLHQYEYDTEMDLHTQVLCLTSCILHISPNLKPTSLIFSLMSSKIRRARSPS